MGSGQSVLLANATMNYKTERKPALVAALDPLASLSRGALPSNLIFSLDYLECIEPEDTWNNSGLLIIKKD